jgi:shikimate kinase
MTQRIFLIGFMGAGKTYWGKAIAAALSLPFFDLDALIEESESVSVTELFTEKGEEYFRYKEKDILSLVVHTHESFVLAAGGGTPCFFNNIDFMKEQGLVVWLQPSVDVIVARLLAEKQKRPLIRNIPDADLTVVIRKKMQERKLYYEQAHLCLSGNDWDLPMIIEQIEHASKNY